MLCITPWYVDMLKEVCESVLLGNLNPSNIQLPSHSDSKPLLIRICFASFILSNEAFVDGIVMVAMVL